MVIETRISLLGHKDHGKSTLIGRILYETKSLTEDRIEEARGICRNAGKEFELAFLLDSFVEEREGGFTLDTTTAQARHDGTIYNLIDVPGHKELVKNMLSGASAADGAILIISAKEDEGLQDETRLHIYLARMLGIRKLVVAVNKMDTVSYSEDEFKKIRSGLKDILAGFGFSVGEITFIPVSAKKGDNVMSVSGSMSWYDGKTLIEKMQEMAANETSYISLPARMPVQDNYSGIVVGRLETGELKEGQEVVVEPAGVRAEIEDLMSATGARIGVAKAGQSVGLRLSNGSVDRGCVLMDADKAGVPVSAIRARIFCLPEARLEVGEDLLLTAGAQESDSKITKIIERMHPINDIEPKREDGMKEVKASEAAEAEIELANPMVLERFSESPPMGRFVIAKNGKIAGVGVVL